MIMLPQQDTGVKPPDGSMAIAKSAKQKGGLGAATLASTNGGGATTEQQQPQRCPRCDSANTKFCYYNNYSLTQPRHFCKNCRRYWTKGGALRNVPVGGGCRKNKRLKHRDPSCLAALAEMDASGSSNILASINGCGIPGFGPSTSSLIQDLANEGHRQLALSRLNAGMQVFDKRFMSENDHNHQGGMSTQDLFALGANSGPPPALLGPFDTSSFPALNYAKPDHSQPPLLFHPHHTSHELTPFFDPISATSPMMTPTLDHLSAFTSPSQGGPALSHHVSANSMGNTGGMDSQLSLIHHNMHMNGMPASRELHSHEDQQQQEQADGIRGGFSEESVEMSMAKSKGRSLISSLPDWAAAATVAQQQAATTNVESFYNVPPQANDSTLWNVSWPEMHAALAGSAAAAGAMLH